MWCRYIYVCMAVVGLNRCLYADDDAFRSASRWLDAREYSTAAKQYNVLIQAADKPWHQAVALLNWKRALLDGEDKEASAQEITVVLAKYRHMPPLLRRELTALLIRIWLSEAEQALHRPYIAEDLEQAYSRLQQAQHYMAALYEAECDLQKAKGAPSCHENIRLYHLHMWLNKLQNHISQAMREDFLHPHSLLEALWRLQSVLMAAKDDLKTLQAIEEQAVFSSYRDVYLNRIQTWQPLLDTTVLMAHEHRYTILDNMTADYEALQVAMNDGDITDAGQVLGKLITAIDKLTSSMQEGLSTAQIFEMLIAHYTRVLRSDPLQKVALELLLQIEANYLRAQMDQSFKIALQAAQNLTEESLDALSQAELRRSRLLLKESQYALMQAIQEHQSQDKPVMRTLKRLIADQKHAAQLVAILLMPGPSMSLSEHKLLQTSQHRTVTSEAAFLTAVSQQQQMDFRGKSGEKGRCQKQPWVRALPPFHSGTAAAMAAATILDNADVLLSLLYRRQLQALENWEQTLEILLQPQVEGDDSCYGEGGTSGEEDSSSGAQPQPSPKDGADVLRNVQLMDLYDHIDKEGSAHIKKTQKPW